MASTIPFSGAARELQARMQTMDPQQVDEEAMRLAIEAGQIGTCDWNYETEDVRWNSVRFRQQGLEPEHRLLSTQEVLSTIHPEDRERMMETARTGIETRGEHTVEFRAVWPDGTTRWLVERGRVVEWEEGRPLRVMSVVFDITEKKRTEEAKRTSEERLRLAVEAGQIGTCDWDYPSGVMRWNEERFRIHGMEPRAENLVHFDEFFTWVHPEDRERVRTVILTGVETRGEHAEEFRIVRPDQTVRWIVETGRVVEWKGEKPLRVLSVVFDATARHTAEAIMRAGEERFRAIVDQTTAGIGLIDLELRISFVNRCLAEMLKVSPDKLVGRLVAEITHPEDAPKNQELLHRLRDAGESFRMDKRLLCEDGTPVWVNVSVSPVRGASGAITSLIAAILDISAQRKAQEALRVSEERLRLVLASAEDFAIFTLDEEGVVLSWNAGAEAIFGYSSEEIIGCSGVLLCTPEDRQSHRMGVEMEIARRKGRAVDERWHLRKNGSEFWGSGSLVPLRLGNVPNHAPGFLKILSDQTEAREASQAIAESRAQLWTALQDKERAYAEAEAAGRAKDHFLAVLSHELRTPLTPVLMAVRTLSRMPDLPQPIRYSLEMIERNVRLEASFIDDLLDLTRIERGKLELRCQPMDVHEALRGAVEITFPDTEAKKQIVTLNLHAGELVLDGDRNRLQQVFWNVLKNASKFTPRGGKITVTSRNEPIDTGFPAQIVVEIADTGIGFDREEGARIFEAFAQASQEITREYGGLGLGLAIARAAVHAHGGTIRCHSPGRHQGATFIVELPLSANGPLTPNNERPAL